MVYCCKGSMTDAVIRNSTGIADLLIFSVQNLFKCDLRSYLQINKNLLYEQLMLTS